MAQSITRSRPGLRWLGAAALMGLVSCTGMDTGRDEAGHGYEGERGASQPGARQDGETAGNGAGAPAGTAIKALPYEPDQLLVRFKSGTSLLSSFATHEQHRTQILRAYRIPSNLHLVKLPPEHSVEKAIELYRRDPEVLYVEPNYIYHPTTVPGDPRYTELWGMDNTGQTGGTADADINAPEAWAITTGSPDVVIGVLDTGFDYTHEDLVDNAFVNPGEIAGNGVDDDGNGFIDDMHGINALDNSGDPMDDLDHGTHVSGTIAGRGDNAIGVTGVSWQAKIVGCKAFSAFGGNIDNILRCMDYFLDLKTRAEHPVNIVATNNSWGGGGFSQALYDAIAAHQQAGMLFVAAAGNSFGNNNDISPFYPSSYDLDNIIAVLATNHHDQRADFSNQGARSVDVGAPGEDILSAVPGNGYALLSGTSMATPHVTGLVALLKTQDPTRSPQAIKNLVLTGGRVTPGAQTTTLSQRSIRADGSLTCVDRVLTSRFAPVAEDTVVSVGSEVALGVLSIDCDHASTEPQTVTVTPGDQIIPLEDTTGTGRFEGVFTPTGAGMHTLTFSTGDVVRVSTVGNYDAPQPVPFECRQFEGTRLALSDDSSAPVTSPFSIQFAGVLDQNTLHVSSNGTIALSGPFSGFSNQALPTNAAPTLIAPFWDDLNPSSRGVVSHAVLGEAPNRELVIEWRDVPHFPSIDGVTFQVVFFESNPNILFNYCDITFGDPALDGGATATIGVQVTREVARQHSFNQAVVSDGSALLFTMGAPLAVAGRDQVVLPGSEVTLDGSSSQDFDGELVSYAWTQIAGEPVLPTDASAPVLTFVAPETSGTLSFQLQVTDDSGRTASDLVDVVVNRPPVAEAGPSVDVGNDLTTALDATASYDPDGTVVGYRWQQLHGDPVALVGGETPTPSFTAPATPQYLVFELTAIDEHGFSGTDLVVVNVFRNAPPVAHAGEDRVVRPGSEVVLDASASTDPDGELVRYDWQVITCVTVDGACELGIEAADTITPRFAVPAQPGLIHLLLTVTDNVGASATDHLILGVFRQAPAAVAAMAERCAISGNTVTLDGSGSSDPDGTIVRHQWTQVGGPAVPLTGADTALATFTAPATGIPLRFQLQVTDDDGLTSSTYLDVTPDTPPVAVAESDAAAVSAGSMVTLDAHQSQGAVTYRWTQIAGPAAVLDSASIQSPQFLAPAPTASFELLTFELTVTNACGSTATDQVSVVVVAGS